ncbi:hypothetical protein C8A05DRAFT_18307, partial [Staphylotrichum tortipilum]
GSPVSSADVVLHCRAQKLSKVAAHLLNLSPVRDLSLSRTKAGGYREIAWSRTGNVEAALMFITGEEPDEPCYHCSRGNGPFSVCIISAESKFDACAGCHYNSEGNRCSFGKDLNGRTRNPNSSTCKQYLYTR